MIRRLLAMLIMLVPSLAWAQSTIDPTVPANNATLSSQIVRQNFLAAYNDLNTLFARGQSLCGTNGQLQFNNNGVCGAFTLGGDATINTATGLLTIAPGGIGSTKLATGAALTNLGFTPISTATRGIANGVPTLDSSGFVPISQLPPAIAGGLAFQGNWNASTNTPTLTSSVGSVGQYYFVSVAGATNLNGTASWLIGDLVLFSSGTWNKIPGPGGGGGVTSVAGLNGIITAASLLNQLSIPAGANGTLQVNNAGALAGVTMSGDATFNAGTGALTLANLAVTNAKMASGAAVANIGFTPLDIAGSNSMTANLNFTGTGRRITADMSNATIANRLAFQNSVANSSSIVTFLPSGSDPSSALMVFGSSNPTNSTAGIFQQIGTETRISNSITGTGTLGPMTFYTGQSERARFDTANGVFQLGAAQTYTGQAISISDAGPASWPAFTGLREPLRVSLNSFPTSYEFGVSSSPAVPDANAIVGGTVCPANINPQPNTYCGGIAGYGYSLAAAPNISTYITATGVAGYGGFGVTSGAAWGLVGFVTNAMGANPASNTGFGGTASVPSLQSGAEIDFITLKKAGGVQPDYITGTGILVQGTADSQARITRATGTINGVQVQVLDTNSYVNKNCDGTGTQSNCWDAAFKSSDGASFVALQIGATILNSPVAAANSQVIAFGAYSNGSGTLPAAGTFIGASDFLTSAGSRTIQFPTGGSITFSENGVGRATLIGSTFVVQGTVGTAAFTFGTLPSCVAGIQGARAFITDASGSFAFASVAAGGGTARLPVYCNSTQWVYG